MLEVGSNEMWLFLIVLKFSQEYRFGDLKDCEAEGYDYSGRSTTVMYNLELLAISTELHMLLLSKYSSSRHLNIQVHQA